MNPTLARIASAHRYATRVGSDDEAEQRLGLATCVGKGNPRC